MITLDQLIARYNNLLSTSYVVPHDTISAMRRDLLAEIGAKVVDEAANPATIYTKVGVVQVGDYKILIDARYYNNRFLADWRFVDREGKATGEAFCTTFGETIDEVWRWCIDKAADHLEE